MLTIPNQTTQELKIKADSLLLKKGIHSLLEKYGQVFYAGSYVLDLMAWPDIDLNLVVNKGKNPNVWPIIDHTFAGVSIHYIDSGIDNFVTWAKKDKNNIK